MEKHFLLLYSLMKYRFASDSMNPVAGITIEKAHKPFEKPEAVLDSK